MITTVVTASIYWAYLGGHLERQTSSNLESRLLRGQMLLHNTSISSVAVLRATSIYGMRLWLHVGGRGTATRGHDQGTNEAGEYLRILILGTRSYRHEHKIVSPDDRGRRSYCCPAPSYAYQVCKHRRVPRRPTE